MNTKELYDQFWQGFIQLPDWPDSTIGSPEKAVHAASSKVKNYYDFDRDLGSGFRPTACITKQKNHVRAELSTQKSGRYIVEKLKANHPNFGHPIEPYVNYHVNENDAKIELAWPNADVENQTLWPVHYRWLRSSLQLLVSIYGPVIASESR